MYLIGLQKAWLFEAPFYTIPISTTGYKELDSENTNDLRDNVATVEFVKTLLSEYRDQNSNPSKD
jgi:hypothetical protein